MKPRSFEDVLIVTAPALFVVLWSSGFIATKAGVLHAEPRRPITALMTWLIFDETLGALALVGMAVCVAGVFLVNWNGRWRRC